MQVGGKVRNDGFNGRVWHKVVLHSHRKRLNKSRDHISCIQIRLQYEQQLSHKREFGEALFEVELFETTRLQERREMIEVCNLDVFGNRGPEFKVESDVVVCNGVGDGGVSAIINL